jgi:hypothetical protein
MANNHQYILRESLPPDDFDRFISTLVRELLGLFGYKDVERVLRVAFIRIQNRLSCSSVTDAAQKLAERIIAREYKSAIKGD